MGEKMNFKGHRLEHLDVIMVMRQQKNGEYFPMENGNKNEGGARTNR